MSDTGHYLVRMSSNGVSGGVEVSRPLAMALAVFFSIAIYNAIELNIIIFLNFKRRGGTYFWSLMAASWGIIIYSPSLFLKFFQIIKINELAVTGIIIGWYAMVMGQGFVLWSRLHLVCRNERKIRLVLYMIIASFFLFQVPTTIVAYGANSANPDPWIRPYQIMEKIQLTGFTIQEATISVVYIFETKKILSPASNIKQKRTREVMRHLIYVNIFVILMDLTLLALEYANRYDIQTAYKGLVYSIKLKLEFSILNQLLYVTRADSDHDGIANSGRGNIYPLTSYHKNTTTVTSNITSNIKSGYSTHAGANDGFNKLADENHLESLGGVLKTTEVTIEHDVIQTDIDKEQVRMTLRERDSTKSGRASSPSSSELPINEIEEGRF
ncbi:MAG: hypothetical protein M1834_007180 [Cirrosporium novae-zelandiae]|nr:MAG: hypothetical protein M1834_007180 [Cirrosporium novae-zelandiae]